MTTVAYAILAHQDPHHVARLARLLLANEGVVSIHYDLSSTSEDFEKLKAELGEDASRVIWPASRVKVGWGEWSIVQATLNMLEALAASGAKLDYVHLMSGSDYPIRPISEFRAFLDRHAGTEFIECADMFAEDWVQGGLTHERYEYRHFFNWKSHQSLFDRSWKIQERLGLRRNFPEGLRPHLGSQWWTLPWRSVETVIAAGRKRALKSFFKTVWIPDEMFIQSVVASAATSAARGPVLTLYQFTDKGVPVVYSNDHGAHLARQPFFFARKISPYANRLRDQLDAYVSGEQPVAAFKDRAFGVRTNEYQRHVAKWGKPRRGVRLLGYEKDGWRGDLVYQEAPILAVYGASHEELRAIAALLNESGIMVCHGALFHPKHIEFVGDADGYAGYANDDIALRDNRRTNFLRDVAKEAGDDATVGFLAPWTMDDHIRDRMTWCSFARNLVVRGNILRAFEEYLKVKDAALAEEDALNDADVALTETAVDPALLEAGATPTKSAETASYISNIPARRKPVPADAFHRFQKEYAGYYAGLWSTFKDASASFTEIDLMTPLWGQQLIDFLRSAELASPTAQRNLPHVFTPERLSKRLTPIRKAAAHIPNAADLLKEIPEGDRRFVHLKQYAHEGALDLDRPIIPIFGASAQELKMVGAVLQSLGVASCHGALFAEDRIEFAGDARSLAGYDATDVDRRDDNRWQFLHEIVRATESENPLAAVAFLMPWSVGSEDGGGDDTIIWHDYARGLIVRGNVLRAFNEYRAQADRPITEPLAGDWVSPADVHTFSDDYARYYARLWEESRAAKADFVEIDLMHDDWLKELLGFFALEHRAEDRDILSHVQEAASKLDDPFLSVKHPVRIINAIHDEKRRLAHHFAFKDSLARAASR